VHAPTTLEQQQSNNNTTTPTTTTTLPLVSIDAVKVKAPQYYYDYPPAAVVQECLLPIAILLPD